MMSPRRFSLLISTAIVTAALVCVTLGSRGAVTDDARHRAGEAARILESNGADTGDSPTRALSLAYVERARLGLGSPFRLIDQAIHDPRLADSSGDVAAWAILDRLFDHGTYEVEASVLDAVGPRGAGADHLALIDRVISSARDPRIGETTVRLAYGLASANGTLSIGAMPVVTEVAAMLRDRALAERDLRRAIPRARGNGVALLEELVRERATRQLDVERPIMGALSPGQQDEAIADVAEVLKRIEETRPASSVAVSVNHSILDARLAPAVSKLGARLPPLAATAVVLQSRGALLRGDSTLSPAMTRFLLSATNEESLVATYAYASHATRGRSIGAARVIVSVAVALRALAQEAVWFPGTVGPSAAEIAGRFGLRAIDFDSDVPLAWRPYYVRMVGSALDDLHRVMPSYEPIGLTVRIGMRALPDSALALHDPRTHTLRMSAATAAGTITHELAHDLDWQSARRLFARGGGYATDRAMTESDGPLANSVRGLAATRVVTRIRSSAQASSRPAEVFARGADWFVADGLAHLGRSNGYLSAIQDQLISGYAASAGDAAALSAAPALVSGMAEMTAIPDSIVSGYLDRWQSLDRIDPAGVMVRVLDAPIVSRRPTRTPFGMDPEMAARLTMPVLCRLDRLRSSGSVRDRIVAATIDARARGIVLRRARLTPEANRPPWAHAILGDVLWDQRTSEDMLHRTTGAVLDGAGRAGLVAVAPLPFSSGC